MIAFRWFLLVTYKHVSNTIEGKNRKQLWNESEKTKTRGAAKFRKSTNNGTNIFVRDFARHNVIYK